MVALNSAYRVSRDRGYGTVRVTAIDVAFVLLIVVSAAVELHNGYYLHYGAILNGLIEPIFWFLTYFAARTAITDVASAVAALKAFVLPIFIAAPISFAQALRFAPVLDLTVSIVSGEGFASAVEDGRLLRAAGLVGGWTSFGAYVSGVFAAALALLIMAKERGTRSDLYPFLVIGLCIASLLTTLTFSTTIAFVVILLGTLRRLGIRPGMLAALCVAGFAAAAIFGALISERIGQQFDGRTRFVEWIPEWVPNTIGYRAYVWIGQTVPTILERPVTGWGSKVYDATFGRSDALDPDRTVPTGLVWTSPESQWFATLMTSGIVGLVPLVLLLIAIAVVLWRGLKNRGSSWIATPVWWLFLANVAIGFTAISFTNKGLPGAFWPLVGIVAALSIPRRSNTDPESQPLPSRPRNASVMAAQTRIASHRQSTD
ncbi:hypothetical protein ASD65_15655 [Microbacterium sp. Root61]|nr:hypothetical protein ASD65_15655 [Microbacterium sp. Root61]